MPSHKFTARSIPQLPSSGQIDYWDDSLPNFGMRVSAGGTRTWIVMYRYNGTKRRMKIGNYPTKSLADARDEAREALRKAEKGCDPATERRKKTARAETIAELADLYIEQHAKRKKRSWLKDRQILDREVIPHIGRKRVIDVSKTDIRGVLQPIIDRDAPIRANHTLEVVRKMFNWAIDERDMPIVNPAARIKKPGETNSRARYLKPDEFKAFWGALKAEALGTHGVAAFQLLALTAQREMEVVKMRWADIDWDDELWTIPAEVAKNEYENVIPLTPRALDLLQLLQDMAGKDDEYVFQSEITGRHFARVFIEKRIIKIREAASIQDFTTHDLRRSATTYFGKCKIPQTIKKKILNHAKKGKTRDVTEIYDRFEYIDEKREALLTWERHLLEMVGESFVEADYKGANVVPFSRKQAKG